MPNKQLQRTVKRQCGRAGPRGARPLTAAFGCNRTEMGVKYEATCRDCSHAFHASGGGGFRFFELHCSVHGQAKDVAHDLIPDATEQYHLATREAVVATGQSMESLLAGANAIDDDGRRRLRDALVEAEDRFNETVEAIVGKCPVADVWVERASAVSRLKID
jgi:hypothetical protein